MSDDIMSVRRVQPIVKSHESCPPSLAQERTVRDEFTLVPEGIRERIFTSRAFCSFSIAGNPKNNDFFPSYVWQFPHLNYITLWPSRFSSKKRQSHDVPAVSGVGFEFARPPDGLGRATHVELKVMPRTKGYIILEIYDSDDPEVSVRKSKDPKNYWLPRAGVDLFKIRIPITPSEKWQTLTVPLAKFVDWNRNRPNCSEEVPGVNEEIGDGVMNVEPKDSFQFQIVLEAEGFDEKASAYIHPYVKFVRYDVQ